VFEAVGVVVVQDGDVHAGGRAPRVSLAGSGPDCGAR
jgi:hypothetical protein